MKHFLPAFVFILTSLPGLAQPINVYLLGDAGKPVLPEDPNLSFLSEQLANGTEQDVLLILGDNLYPEGLPPKEHPNRKAMEKQLNPQLDLIKNFKGRSYMIPGNHDWKSAGKDGFQAILDMQAYVEEYLGTATVFLPARGCPGPVEVALTNDITLLILDTQYLLHPWEKPGEESDCDSKSTFEALMELDRLVRKNAHKHVIVAGHHPLYSHGPHGGLYTFRQHIFPLTDVNRKLYIPLPVIGSIYPLFRQLIGSRQDLNHPRYKLIRRNLTTAFEACDDLVYVSGHEHSMQYLQVDEKHYLVSGSGSKSSPVKKGKGTVFHHQGIGFANLEYDPSGKVLAKFWNGESRKLLNMSEMYEKDVIHPNTQVSDFDFEDSTVTVSISDQYLAGSIQKKLLGSNYRELWATPLEVPVLNIGTEHGGLSITKLGGGNQTRSLRLEDAQGHEYVLRTLNKYTDKLVPEPMRRTLAADILQDEISAANPYGAYVVPSLAASAGLYYTLPKVVFIPDDPRFGAYRELFAGQVVLYEERPTKESAHEPHFGSGEKIISTTDLLIRLQKDNDNQVDQAFTLRSRLLDNLIGDWDRHDDQWRWVNTEDEHITTYRPIPRDRDQAFFVNNGVIPWLASRKFALPNTEGFDEEIDYSPGFNTSGRFFDRSFLNELGWQDWEKELAGFQAALSDKEIENAFSVWPEAIRFQAAEETISILKKRRDNLTQSAREHYLFLAREVEVTGSDKHEFFLVERLNDEETNVTVWKRKKDGTLDRILYKRTFKTSETQEVRLYGFGGEDVFELKGGVRAGIRIRIIGGNDKDKITDGSSVSGWNRMTEVYDLKEGTVLEPGKETKPKLSDDVSVNAYNRAAFKYNKLVPLLSAQFNPDDGIFLGGGFLYTKHGWREEPFAQQHNLKANLALETWAMNVYYTGTVTDVLGKWDWITDLTICRPFGVSNYFGMGNESEFLYREKDLPLLDDPIDYYRIRYEQVVVFTGLSRNLGQKGSLIIGPRYLGYELEENRQRFISSPASDQDPARIYRQFFFGGVHSQIKADTRTHPQLPERGVYASASYDTYLGLTHSSNDFSMAAAEFSFFLTAHLPLQVTLANKIGANASFGQYEFFNAAALGRETLRGYRRTRFLGDEALYHNVDLRIKLASFRTYLFPGSLGVVGFHDVGRVWLEGEQSSKWHRGIGAGIWVAPLNKWVFVVNMAFTEEENLPSATVGFQF